VRTFKVLQLLQNKTRADVYLVGGYVRDFLRNKKSNDLDVVIRGLAAGKVKKFLSKHGKVKQIKQSRVNDDFRVSTIIFKASKDSEEAHISLPKNGRKQRMDYRNKLKEDAFCRDFTINALYLPINFKSKDDVINFSTGIADVKHRRILTINKPSECIKLSPIRIMRALSQSAMFGFKISKPLQTAMKNHAHLLEKVPAEAIRIELNKILTSKKPSRYFMLMHKLGILKIILPEIHACVGVKQDKRYHKYDVFKHCIYTCDNIKPDLALRWAAILHDVGKPATKQVITTKDGSRTTFHKHEMVGTKLTKQMLTRLKYDNELKKEVAELVKLHMYHYTREFTDAAVRRFIKRAGIKEKDLGVLDRLPLFRLRSAERLGNGYKTNPITDKQRDFQERIIRVYKESSCLDLKDLDINGHIIMETFNLERGVRIGEILNFLMNKVLDNPDLNEKLKLLKLVVEFLHNRNEAL